MGGSPKESIVLRVPTEKEAFDEFSSYVKTRRENEGLPPVSAQEMRKCWDILEGFRKAWGLAPSSTSTPPEDSAPRGGGESGNGSGS